MKDRDALQEGRIETLFGDLKNVLALKLLVQKGSVDSATQDWGMFNFVSAPSPGDRIAAEHEGRTNHLTVLSVHHRPVAARDAAQEIPQDVPAADVVAIWTSAD